MCNEKHNEIFSSNYFSIVNKVHEWAIKNEMIFGINKCATFVVKPINFVKLINYEDTSFFIGS